VTECHPAGARQAEPDRGGQGEKAAPNCRQYSAAHRQVNRFGERPDDLLDVIPQVSIFRPVRFRVSIAGCLFVL